MQGARGGDIDLSVIFIQDFGVVKHRFENRQYFWIIDWLLRCSDSSRGVILSFFITLIHYQTLFQGGDFSLNLLNL